MKDEELIFQKLFLDCPLGGIECAVCNELLYPDILTSRLKEFQPFEYIETFYKDGWRVRIIPLHKIEVYMNWDGVDKFDWATDSTLEGAFIKAVAMYLRWLKC